MTKLEQIQKSWREQLQSLEEMCDDDSDQMVAMYRRNISTLITEVWNEAIKECEGCVPESAVNNNTWNTEERHSFDLCRTQTLQAISKLRV